MPCRQNSLPSKGVRRAGATRSGALEPFSRTRERGGGWGRHTGLLGFAITALVLSFGIPSPVIRMEVIICILFLCFCCALARRRGFLGPVGDSRTARRVRTAGCGVVMTCLLIFDKPPYPKDTGWWLAGAILVLYLVAVLSATARISQPDLRVAAYFTLAGTIGWWIPMLGLSAVRAAPHASLVLVGLAVLVCSISVGGTSKSAVRGLLAGLGAGAATCLLIFFTAVGTYAALPNLVPDISGPTCCAGGLTPADRAETNRIESTDPYIAELVLGAVMSVFLIGGLAVSRTTKQTSAVAITNGPCEVTA